MLKACHLLIGFVLLVLSLSEATYLPGYEYIQGVGWLRLHIVPATWPDAQLRCHLEDATLTAPTTSAITAVMKRTMLAHRLAESSVFTDIYASNPKGDYININGLSVSSSLQWAVGEPNNLGNGEDCLVMTGAGELADVSCSSVHPFFCLKRNTTSTRDECDNTYIANECNSTLEANQSNTTFNENECNCTIEATQCNTTQETNHCDTIDNVKECNSTIVIVNECVNSLEATQCITPQEANPCDTTAEGYTLEPRTGSCYKFHRTALPWRRAAMTCASERAHLAVINSEEESQVIRELFEQNPKSTIMFAKSENYAHLGFLDWNKQGQWLTVFGKTLAEAGYSKWESGEPNHLNRNEFCGSVLRNGKLNDSPCASEKFPYICEISPKF